MVIGAGRPPLRGEAIDQFVGAERLVARQQRLEHAAADRRQPLGTRRADRLGIRDGVARAALVIVVGRRKYRPRRCFSGHANIRLACVSVTCDASNREKVTRGVAILTYILQCNNIKGSFALQWPRIPAASPHEDFPCSKARPRWSPAPRQASASASPAPWPRRAPTSSSTALATRPRSKRSARAWRRNSASRRSIRRPT